MSRTEHRAMSGRAGRVKPIFLVAALAVACGALSHGRPSSAEPDGAKADAGNGGAAESSRAPGDRGQRRPPDARPPVVVLPPAPSAYESVPQESLTEWVAKVNGDRVSVRLFERRLKRSRFSAFQRFGARYAAKPGADFWSTPYEGQTPAEWLKERTLEDCVKIKIELGLAKENGVIGDTSYGAFLKTLDRENQRRRNALAAGEPIYGPQQYREDEFFLYLMSNMRIVLQRRLSETRLHASEETLREHYESIKDTRYDRGHRVRVWTIQVQYGKRGGYAEWLTRAEARARIEEAKKRLDDGERFEDVAARYNENAELGEDVFDFESRLTDRSHRASRREEAMSLSEGETSGIFEDMSAFFILKCVEKEKLGCQPYDEVRESVRRHYVDQKYQALVNQLVEAAEVEVNRTVLAQVHPG